MTIIWILIGVLILYVFGKWVMLLLLSPVIVLHLKRERKKSRQTYERDLKIINSSLSEAEADQLSADQNKRNSVIKKSLGGIISFITSFERYILIQIGFIPSHTIRNFFYKNIFLVRMEKGAVIHYGAEIRGSYNLILKSGAIIGDRCVLDARRGYIKIGRNVQLGNFVNLWTGSHDYNDPYFRSKAGKRGPIEIQDYCWLGPRSTVLYGVNIGEGAVIGAGSIVTKDVPPFSVMTGVPAHKVGNRNKDLRYNLGDSHIHFY